MLHKVSSVLGIGLLMLWGFGLGDPSASKWLTWMDGVAALAAFMIAIFTPAFPSRSEKMGRPLALSAGLYFLWIIGLATSGARWLAWWNLGFATAFFLLGLANSSQKQPHRLRTLSEFEKDEKIRRGA